MNIKKIGAAVLVGALFAGCDGDATKQEEIVLTVNGANLTRSAVNADVDAILAAQGSRVPEDQKAFYKQMIQNQIAKNFIFENVLAKKAKAEGFLVTDADRKEREDQMLKAFAGAPDAPKTLEEHFKKYPLGEERARRELDNGILIDKLIKSKLPNNDFEAKAEAEIASIVSNNAAVASAEAAAVAKIKDLKAQLDKVPEAEVAAKFAELAKANSACPSSAKGGDLGEFTHGQMVPEFDEAAFKLPVNKVSDPIKTQFGYHLILVTKKIPAVEASGDKPAENERVRASHILVKSVGARPVPEKAAVIKRLQEEDSRKFVSGFVEEEMKKATIVAHADDFKQFVPAKEGADAASDAKGSIEKSAAK